MEYEFNQNDFIEYIRDNKIPSIDPKQIKEAQRILNRYNGFCNHITSQDILGDTQKMANYKETSNLQSLLNSKYTDSHILNINSITRFFQLILCIFFKYYPESPLGLGDQKDLNSNNDNTKETAIDKALDGMKAGDYYKLCTVERKYGMPLNGHSMLIYKANDDRFTFFDPNSGAKTDLDKAGIRNEIKDQGTGYEISIMDNKKFLAKHHSQFISELQEVAAQSSVTDTRAAP